MERAWIHGILSLVTFPCGEIHHRVRHNSFHQQCIQGGLMIELEIQALSERREGLLIEVGRLVVANGFTLQRQRLTQDAHGILLTMVVRGSPRKQRALEAALDAYERIISFEVSAFVEGDPKPHFAASRAMPTYTPDPAPPPPAATAAATAAPAADVAVQTIAAPIASATPHAVPELQLPPEPAVLHPPEPEAAPEPEPDFEFLLATPSREPPPPPPAPEPFVELVPLDADEAAVEKVLSRLATEFPQIVPRLLALDQSVAEAARESSLALAGQRIGAWVFNRDCAAVAQLDLQQAIERVALPALSALVEVEHKGDQLHIHDSPLCTQQGHSGCSFFSGYLEGLLGPALHSPSLSIFAVCCRSYGADACVLALSD